MALRYTDLAMKEVRVVTCFLLRRGQAGDEVLLLRRSRRVATYRGRWAAVSGYLESDSALAQALREIEEETSLSRQAVRLLAEGRPLQVADEALGVRWTVHPFLFEATRPEQVRLDWEHVELRWVPPQDIATLETVPGLREALARVYPATSLERRA